MRVDTFISYIKSTIPPLCLFWHMCLGMILARAWFLHCNLYTNSVGMQASCHAFYCKIYANICQVWFLHVCLFRHHVSSRTLGIDSAYRVQNDTSTRKVDWQVDEYVVYWKIDIVSVYSSLWTHTSPYHITFRSSCQAIFFEFHITFWSSCQGF